MKSFHEAMRIHRTIIPILALTTPMALTTGYNIPLILLAISCLLIYPAASIHNAYIDKDFRFSKWSKRISQILILLALAVTAFNHITFITALVWVFLGIIYNTVSRHILFADTLILTITHFLLPFVSALYLLNIVNTKNLSLGLTLSIIFFLLSQMKNLKGIRGDKMRNYKTIATVFKNGYLITNILFLFSISLMVSVYYILGHKLFFLSTIIIFFLLIFTYCVREEEMLKIVRFIFLFFTTSIIIYFSSHLLPIFVSLALCIIYTVPILKEVRKNEFNLRYRNRLPRYGE